MASIKLNKYQLDSLSERIERCGIEGEEQRMVALYVISRFIECAKDEALKDLFISSTYIIDATDENETTNFINGVLDKRVISDFNVDFELGPGNGLLIKGNQLKTNLFLSNN